MVHRLPANLASQCAADMKITVKMSVFFYPRAKKVMRWFIEKQKFGNNVLLYIVLSYIGPISITFVLSVL
jgi:hypothetical protein